MTTDSRVQPVVVRGNRNAGRSRPTPRPPLLAPTRPLAASESPTAAVCSSDISLSRSLSLLTMCCSSAPHSPVRPECIHQMFKHHLNVVAHAETQVPREKQERVQDRHPEGREGPPAGIPRQKGGDQQQPVEAAIANWGHRRLRPMFFAFAWGGLFERAFTCRRSMIHLRQLCVLCSG